MFLHLSVSHSVDRGGAWAGGACMAGGDMHGGGGCVWRGSMHGWGGACVVGGMRAMHARPTSAPDTTRYGRSMRGRYVSYWNAFMFLDYFFETFEDLLSIFNENVGTVLVDNCEGIK